jgi:hypothetical protein
MKAGDKMVSNNQPCVIVAVEREYKYPIPGRYTVRFSDGRVVENYPGYLLKEHPSAAVWRKRK